MLVNAASNIHRSASGASLENQNIEFVVSEVKALSLRLDRCRMPHFIEPDTRSFGEDQTKKSQVETSKCLVSHQNHVERQGDERASSAIAELP
jgi:hypothetical protein